MRHNSSYSARVYAGFIIGMAVVVITTSLGCEPLRKKFIRKKKKEAQQDSLVPILDPIEYPPRSKSSQERYAYHYALWRVWYRDFLINLDENGSDKRQRYLMDQMILQLGEMTSWVVSTKREELLARKAALEQLKGTLDEPRMMRNTYTIKTQVESVGKSILNDYRPLQLEGFYVKSP